MNNRYCTARGALTLLSTFWIICGFWLPFAEGSDNMSEAQVRVMEGLLQGRVAQTARRALKYYSFQGIPYAQPPVGNYRFKPPVPITPWSGVREALKEGPRSPSTIFPTMQIEPKSSEDCLYLNVYTRQLPSEAGSMKQPVMFYIHGGGFLFGSGDADVLAPDHLLEQDVVVVTINYRLGALGFLSLQNEALPGNNGLRDQVEALKWTQRNIASFGGDPHNVTIFGQSAGAASVQFLMLTPLSKGLFHRAISQSGSVLNPWALSLHPVECAFTLGRALGLNTTDKRELLDFLMKAPVSDIVIKSTEVLKTVEPEKYFMDFMTFNPVVEPNLPGAFISRDPEDLLREGKVHDLPYIMGVVEMEGPIIMKPGTPIAEPTSKEEWERLLPFHPKVKRGTPLANSILDKIKAHYFSKGFTKRAYADVLSWEYYMYGNHQALQMLSLLSSMPSRKSQIYSYQFTYDGAFGYMKAYWGIADVKGTFHTDELSYLFWVPLVFPGVSPGSNEDKMIDTITKVWADFAKYGNPTPSTGVWKPYAAPHEDYLDINLNLTAGRKLDAEHARFWRGIYTEIAMAPTRKRQE